MIVILPTGTGFIVGTLATKYPKTKREVPQKTTAKAPRRHWADYWAEVREWMHPGTKVTV